MQAWLTAPYEFYFSEDGLMDFVRTGRIVDVDASLTGPLPPEARRELLLRMRTACENNTAVLRIVSAEAFPLYPHITIRRRAFAVNTPCGMPCWPTGWPIICPI